MTQTFTNKGEAEHVTPKSQRVGEVVAQDTSSSGRRKMSSEPETFSRAPQRDARAKKETASAPARETAEAAPEETQAERKPEARKTAARKARVSDEGDTSPKEKAK